MGNLMLDYQGEEVSDDMPGRTRRRWIKVPTAKMLSVLRAQHYNINATVRELGVARNTVYNFIVKTPEARREFQRHRLDVRREVQLRRRQRLRAS